MRSNPRQPQAFIGWDSNGWNNKQAAGRRIPKRYNQGHGSIAAGLLEKTGMRILVMDDYRPHGESLAELLQTKGHDAIYAQSYADAQWLFELFHFDSAFLDFDMPALSGPAVAAKLSEQFPTLLSVIVSAIVPAGARRAELRDLPFLKKPVLVEALWDVVAAIERQLAGSSLVRRMVYPLTKYQEGGPRGDRPL